MKEFVKRHWVGFVSGCCAAAIALSVHSALTALEQQHRPAPAKIQPLFSSVGEKLGTDAAGKIADALKGVKWPRRITASVTVDFEYVGDPPPAE